MLQPDHYALFALPARFTIDEAALARAYKDVQGRVLYVDDGSRDATWNVLRTLAANDPRVSVMRLSRNFGKEAALTAGLDRVDAGAAIILDADGQDPPELIGEFVREWQAGYDNVHGTRIERDESDLTIEDLITPQDVVVTLTHGGYAKATPVSEYRAQGRGGRGRQGTTTKDEDFVTSLFVANTHTQLLFFTTDGMVYTLKTWRLPLGNRNAVAWRLVPELDDLAVSVS